MNIPEPYRGRALCPTRRPYAGLARVLPLLTGLIFLLWVTHGSAQTIYGSIVGTVRDASGAVIADASVEARQIETNEKRTATTDNDGLYVLSTLPAGAYTISISKPGFDLYEAKGVELAINTTVRVDANLIIGSQPVAISVSANTADLQTDRADVHGVVTEDELQQLPQPTRTYEGLVGMLPGVTPPQPNAGGTNNPARSMLVSVNGTSPNGTNVSIEGISATNPWVQFYSTAVPSYRCH